MSYEWGCKLKLSVFGTSHGPVIGMVLDGLPAGEAVDLVALQAFLDRRAPGTQSWQSSRRERDIPRILSGFANGFTTGAALCGMIDNQDQHSGAYRQYADCPRPGHGDYPAGIKYRGFFEQAGGGHLSGRMTAAFCLAGGICQQLLAKRGVFLAAHAFRIGDIVDQAFDPVAVAAADVALLAEKNFPTLDIQAGERMIAEIEQARQQKDSLGGLIELAAVGLPPGLGEPLFGGVENRLSAALFAIPAVRGVEFGEGFAAAASRGSLQNDAYYYAPDGRVLTATNHHGGVLAGMTTGMPLLLRVAVKPTPSIGQEQQTVDLRSGENVTLRIVGRHDPCIVPRAVPVVEAVASLVLLDLLLSGV